MQLQFIDTHTHLYDEAYGDISGQDGAVQRAIGAGVTRMVVPDICSRERTALAALCARWPENTFPCAGLHPEEVDPGWRDEADMVEKCLLDGMGTSSGNGPEPSAHIAPEKIAAIGEIGLDLHWSSEFAREQEEALRCQLDLALQHALPVIIHSRDATEQMFRILEDYRGRGLRGVFHAFTGSIETFRRLDRYGHWYAGIGGVLTFRKASIAETVKDIPLGRILLETDSPYLPPVPHRGERNESAYIPLIADFLAQRKGVCPEDVAAVTCANAQELFGLAKN